MSSTNSTGDGPSLWLRLKPGPLVYVSVLVFVLFVSFFAHMRLNGVFACPADLYGGDHYLGHCESTAYGDYDHGAFWFGLEPEAVAYARSADVVFVGNSRMQFGFSAPSLGFWFASQDRTYYLLGFSHGETVNFLSPLLGELRPRARVYVVDADEFFTDFWSGPARDVLRGENTEARYRAKRVWQIVHRFVCGQEPRACGRAMAFYRQRETGAWRISGNAVGEPAPVDRERPLDEARVAQMRARATEFVASLNARPGCVIFTYVPPRESDRATVSALAATVGAPFVSPQVEGLRTFDGSHLDRPSAERFTRAFLQEAGPLLSRCLTDVEPSP